MLAGADGVPRRVKVSVNAVWDVNVPSPLPGSEDAVQKAMAGEDGEAQGWFVPVVVSDPRADVDKGESFGVRPPCIGALVRPWACPPPSGWQGVRVGFGSADQCRVKSRAHVRRILRWRVAAQNIRAAEDHLPVMC